MPRYRYVTADVFTDRVFGGNQLAVFPDARGLDDETMFAIAREFNFSETTFVFPARQPAHTREVRIFTPGGEVPFAGHPTVGTAHVLAAIGEVPLPSDEVHLVLEEKVGPVPVVVRAAGGKPVFAQLTVAQLPQVLPPPPPRADLAKMLSLEPDDLLTGAWSAQAVSCGLPFLIVPVKDRDALRRSRVRLERWESLLAGYVTDMVYLFALDPELPGSQVRARMYAPGISVPEDPATGSAAVALGGYLAARDSRTDGTLTWGVEQGFEMGRPSLLHVEVDKVEGDITAVRVGGQSVLVCEGFMDLP